jgi:hypothetical protein
MTKIGAGMLPQIRIRVTIEAIYRFSRSLIKRISQRYMHIPITAETLTASAQVVVGVDHFGAS